MQNSSKFIQLLGCILFFGGSSAIAEISAAMRWTDARGDWQRRTFASRADNVVVTQLLAPSGADSLTCSLSVEPWKYIRSTQSEILNKLE